MSIALVTSFPEYQNAKIFVGDRAAGENLELLAQHQISLVVTVTDQHPLLTPQQYEEKGIRFQRYAIRDETVYPNKKDGFMWVVRLACRTIRNGVHRGKNILVHCLAGINRSPLTIGTCLVGYFDHSPEKALELLTKANESRGIDLLTNESFRGLLNEAGPIIPRTTRPEFSPTV